MQSKKYLLEAFNKMIVKRGLRVALIVGIILNLINQGYAILNGFNGFHLTQFLLTFLVPYVVSTYSSVLSRFNFVSGEVAGFDAHITCKRCGKSSIKIQKGDVIPYCSDCSDKTKWKIIDILPPDYFLGLDNERSNALFAEYNPAPVLRVDRFGKILKANPTAIMLFGITGKNENITNYIEQLKGWNFEDFISSNEIKTIQIQIGNDFYQLDIRAIADLEILHIYASKNTTFVLERNQRILFQKAIEQASDSVMITSPIGNIVYVNPAFEAHTGYTQNEVYGKNPRILNSGYQPPELYKEMWQTISSGKNWKGVFKNRKKNGDEFWERATIIPIVDSEGVISHYMAIKEDLTQELQLKEKLNSFALFAKNNPDPVLRIDSNFSIIEANPAAREVLNRDKVDGEDITKLIPELNGFDLMSLIKDNSQVTLQVAINGSYYNFVVKGISELNHINIYGSNITKQVEAEEQVHSMALFAELNPEPVFRFDKQYKIIEANPAAKKVFPELKPGNDIRNIIEFFSSIPVGSIIDNNAVLTKESTVNNRIYQFLLRGISHLDICQVYSSDITVRVKQEIEIKEQAQKIQSSIQYASNIQQAILPEFDYINRVLPEHLLLYRPRDVVSGDFYWLKKINDSIVIAAVDCTGHGVPGAFMSMLGVAFLNEVVTPEALKADVILNKLREHIISTLSNSSESRSDGMDMALCIIEPNNNTIQYAGANNPFVLVNENGLMEIRGDRMPIGKYVKQDKPFSPHLINYKKGDTVYLFSDGYHDQLGGPGYLKYGSKRFKQLLTNIHKLDFAEQKQILINEIETWMGENSQIDDILVMGFRL